MMMPSLLTPLVVYLVVQGVSGADKELGQTCDPAADKCVHPSIELTCDAFAKKCLIQQDKACDGAGHKYLCVTGAECDGTSNKCACKTTTYSASGVACSVVEDKYAGACPTSGTCATASNLVCSSGFCGCTDATFKPKLSDGTCEALADSQIGQACTAGGSECGVASSTFMSCPSGGDTCACNTDYTGPFGGSCTLIPNEKKGKQCTSGNAATTCGTTATTHLECDTTTTNACQCVANYYGVTGGECYPAAGKLNGGCSGTGKGTCEDSDALCTGTGAKSCKSGLGGACMADSDCSDSTTMICDDFEKKCLLKTDQPCNTDAKKDKCVTGAACDTAGDSPSNQCKCIPNVFTVSSNKCYATAGKATGTCNAADPKCEDANAECDTTPNRCKCKTGYSVKTADATCEKSGAVAVMASAVAVMLAAVSAGFVTLH